jgi:hypothetical protein
MIGWDRYGLQQKRVETHNAELMFCIQWDLRVMYCILLCSRCKTLTRYFSSLGGIGTDSTKSVLEHNTSNLCFCIRWDLSHVVHSVHPGRETSMHYFSCLGGTGLDSRKSAMDTEVMFLHSVGSAGHVVYCGASGS